MQVEFDAAKDVTNREKHGLSLAEAARLDLDTAAVIPDARREDNEARCRADGTIDGRLPMLAFTMRGAVVRVISVRKANAREEQRLDIEAEAIDDADNPEWSEADCAKAVPFEEAHPEAFAAWTRRRGRPPINDRPKAYIGFRLDADVVEGVKATGRGYNSRVEKVLRDALAKGLL